jgi:hypothetical protein
MTIDKGQILEHLWKIKKIPHGHSLLPETEDMSGKTWTFGNLSVDRLVHEYRQVSVYGCAYVD